MNYSVIGLAVKDDYGSYTGDCPYQQFFVNELFSLPEELPDIKTVDQILLEPVVLDYQLIGQSARPKIWLSGLLRFQLLYTASGPESPEHTGFWEKRFATFLELRPADHAWQAAPGVDPYFARPRTLNDNPQIESHRLAGVHLLIEHFTLHLIHGRKFEVSALVFAYGRVN